LGVTPAEKRGCQTYRLAAPFLYRCRAIRATSVASFYPLRVTQNIILNQQILKIKNSQDFFYD